VNTHISGNSLGGQAFTVLKTQIAVAAAHESQIGDPFRTHIGIDLGDSGYARKFSQSQVAVHGLQIYVSGQLLDSEVS
jgi:hypothetical protein